MSLLVTSGGVVTLGGGVPRRGGETPPVVDRWADSPSYVDVSAAITAASVGDVVGVPAGSATWDSTLAITKRIWLIGAGIGQTNITYSGASRLLTYATTEGATNNFFRLSGFTFTFTGTADGPAFTSATTAHPRWMRIDHNRFVGRTTTGPVTWTMYNMWGVIDQNQFVGAHHYDNYGYPSADGQNNWRDLSFVPGTVNNLYYEDNTYEANFIIDSGGRGGRYCRRYNTYTLNAMVSPSPAYNTTLHDAHGNQGPGPNEPHHATMGVEIYGERIDGTLMTNGVELFDHRGGKAMVFFNRVNSNTNEGAISLREEWDDANSVEPVAADGTPQHVNRAYYWNNRKGSPATTQIVPAIVEDQYDDVNANVPPVLVENETHWLHTTSFDGSGGVGCGPLASRPASATNVGCAYWATDQDTTEVLDAQCGASPSASISGTLYRWNGSAWETYYAPFTYPHPFRSL